MVFSDQRDELRNFYFNAWKKYREQQPLSALEHQITAVIALHPEYHALFDRPEEFVDRDYLPEFGETNPFLHLGLHLGIREQISINQPAGIGEIFTQLRQRLGDGLAAEHQMMDCLAEQLWLAQRNNRAPDPTQYLQALRALVNQ